MASSGSRRSIRALALLLLAAVASAVQMTGKQIFYETEDYAVYTSVSFSGSADDGTLRAVSGTWLNPPQQMEMIDALAGQELWTYVYENDPNSPEFEAYGVRGKTFAAGLVFDGNGNNTCHIRAFTTSAAQVSGTPSWTVKIPTCYADAIDVRTLQISEDASTLSVFVFTHVSYKAPPTASLFVFDAQTGKQKWSYDFPATVQSTGPARLSETGKFLVVNTGVTLYIFDAVKGTIIYTTTMQYNTLGLDIKEGPNGGLEGAIAAYGLLSAEVIRYSNGQWNTIMSVSVPDTNIEQMVISEDKKYLAVASIHFSFLQNQLDVYKLSESGGTLAWSYLDKMGGGTDQNIPSDIATCGDYVVFSAWGDQNKTNPQVQAFSFSQGNVPVYSYFTNGSPFSVDIACSAKNPSSFYVASAGKLAPASEMGYGGELFIYSVSSSADAAEQEGNPSMLERMKNFFNLN